MGTPAVYEFQYNGAPVIQVYYPYDGYDYGLPKVIDDLMRDPRFIYVLAPKLVALSDDMSVSERECMARKFASWLTFVVRPLFFCGDNSFTYVRHYAPQYRYNLISKKNGEGKS